MARPIGQALGSPTVSPHGVKLLFFVTEDWYFISHRLELAVAAKAAGYDVSVATRLRSGGKKIQEAGLRLIPFEIARSGLNPLREVGTVVRLLLLYRRERPDLLHHVGMKPVLYGSLAAWLTGIGHVVNALAGMGWLFTSGTGLASFIRPLVRRGLAHLLSRGAVLVQNADDAALIESLGIHPEWIHQIPGSGVDLDQFRPTAVRRQALRVVFPGRLLWDKGIQEFVDAARVLRARGVEAHFMLAGEPDPANPASISDADLRGWVTEGAVEHLGWVSDMPALLDTCDIVCLPSYREGLPKSLAEAAAAGKPIITTDVPGCREVVRDCDNGLLVPAKDTMALVTAMERLLLDSDLRGRMGRRGRQRAEEEFGLVRVIARTLAVYRTVLE